MNSWDCFDTLIGRKYFDPKSIFHVVANKINDPSFVSKRIKAEKKSKKKTYEDIYKHLPKYDPNLELQTELEYSFPIKSNFNMVQDGDVVVSDMYLNIHQIEKILRYHGLDKDIKIYSSYGGKKHGWMWDTIKAKHNIINHTGDNIDSDVNKARNHGINAIFFPGRFFTEKESILKNYSYDLACLCRMLRLLNPYHQNRSQFIHSNGSFFNICGNEWIEEIAGNINFFNLKQHSTNEIILNRSSNKNILIKILNDQILLNENSSAFRHLYSGQWHNFDQTLSIRNDHRLIWNDQTQYNIPALINISKFLPHDYSLVFCYRDCLYLKYIYDSIYKTNSKMLDVSRKAYQNPYNKEYVQYIIDTTQNSIIVDSHGRGKTANDFFNRLNISRKLIHVCLHDAKKNKKHKIFHSTLVNCANKEHYSCAGRAFEKFNIPYLGPLVDFKDGIAIRAPSEHDATICDIQFKSIQECCRYIGYYPNIQPNKFLLNNLLELMKFSYTSHSVKSIKK